MLPRASLLQRFLLQQSVDLDRKSTMTNTPATLHASVDELVAAARALVSAGRRHVLGITGTPGAGKSTVSDALITALGDDAVLVGMDGFHLSNRQLLRLGRSERKGAPDTFDVAGYKSTLERVRDARETVYAPVFDRRIEESIAAVAAVGPDVPLVITEGNYLLLDEHGWAGVRPLLDTVWFVDVSPEERRRRLQARRRSHGHAADAAAAWVNAVDEPNAQLVEVTRSTADVIVQLALDPVPTPGVTLPTRTEGAPA